MVQNETLQDILISKPRLEFKGLYEVFDYDRFRKGKIPLITVHGRFQPPLHINHWNYISNAFRIADRVTILITNPDLKESAVRESVSRNKPENNPFTYEERVKIFESFFDTAGIPREKYKFKPFNITDEKSWNDVLDKEVPNLINTYGEWSNAKLEKFRKLGYKVVHSSIPKGKEVSGTLIREILKENISTEEKKIKLIEAGYMPEAIDGLFNVLGWSR